MNHPPAWTLRGLLAVVPALALAACVGGSSGGSAGGSTGSGASGAGFVPGQTVEVLSTGGVTPPPGQCVPSQQTAWVTETASVALVGQASLGPDKQQLACEVALQQLQSSGEQRCATNYNSPGVYRNPVFLPAALTASACRCTETVTTTDCEVSATAQCGYEAMTTQTVQICG
ncbi:MAG: hypothetical protein R3F55_13300 [Alphaproteobacteria bacterium]